MKAWWRNLPLHIKLHLPIQLVLLVLLPAAHLWVLARFESTLLEDARLKTQDSVTQSLLALNSMMLTDAIRNPVERSVFLQRMSAQKGVEDFHLVRAEAVQKQFGPGLEMERQGDELDRRTAESGTVQTALSEQGKHTLRVVVPFTARSEFYGVNCLLCHQVPEGTVLGTISLTTDLEPEYARIRRFSSALLAGQVFLQLTLFVLIGWLIRSVTRSVVNLESAMLYIERSEDFSKRVDVRGNDEIGQIAKVFNGLIGHVEELHLRLAEKVVALEKYHDQTEEELRIGSDIMSRITDAQSTIDPAVRSLITPAAHYSGDIILVSRTPSDTLHIMLADAVGHGLVAAMNLLPLSLIFNAMSKKGLSVSRIAEELNSRLHRLMPADRFVGAVLVSIDFRNRIIEVWNGGVPAPQLVSMDGVILHGWKSRNLPLGVLDEDEFSSEAEVLHYEQDCQLFLFSDGFVEAESFDGGQFGMGRIAQVLQNAGHARRFETLLSALADHLGGISAHDDVSLAMVGISMLRPQEEFARRLVKSHSDGIPGSYWRFAICLGEDDLKYLDTVSLIMQVVGSIRTTAEHHSQLFVILSELFNNALDHGILRLDSSIKQGAEGFEKYMHLREERLRSLDSGTIDIEIERTMIDGRCGIKIHVIDSGNGFDYSSISDGPVEKIAMSQYGRGLFLVKNLACKLVFSGRGNEVEAYYLCD